MANVEGRMVDVARAAQALAPRVAPSISNFDQAEFIQYSLVINHLLINRTNDQSEKTNIMAI